MNVYQELLVCPCTFLRLLLSSHLKLTEVQIISQVVKGGLVI